MEEVLVLEKPKQGRRTEAKHARCEKHADCGANDLEDASTMPLPTRVKFVCSNGSMITK